MPGYHLHFLSEDLNGGGHILDFCLERGEAQIDICNNLFLILTEAENDFSRVDFSKDRTQDLENAEKINLVQSSEKKYFVSELPASISGRAYYERRT